MLNTLRSYKSTFAAFGFAIVLLSSAPVLTASPSTSGTSDASWTSNLTLKNAAWVAFFISMARYWSREGDAKPCRYNLDELAAGDNIMENLYYLVDDGVIGHKGKKPYVIIDESNGRVMVSTPAWPKGLYGWAHYYFKPMLSAIGTVVFFQVLFDTANESGVNSKNFADKFFENLGKKVKSLVKMSDIGTLTAVGVTGYALAK